MDIKTNKNKKIIILFSIMFIFSSIILFFIIANDREKRIEKILQTNYLENIKTHYEVLSYKNRQISDSFYNETISNKKVLALLENIKKSSKKEKETLKISLYNSLEKQFKRMQSLGIYQFNVLLPNNKIFLYMHKLEQIDDNDIFQRTDYKKVNENKITIRGFHRGKLSHGFKNLYPIFSDEHEYLGAIEISFNSTFLQNSLTRVSKIHTHFLVHKDLFKGLEWDSDSLLIKYKQSNEHKDYLVSILTEHNTSVCGGKVHKYRIAQIVDELSIKMLDNKAFVTYMQFDGKTGVLSFFPISDTNNKTVAWLASYEEDKFIESIYNHSYILITILISALLIMFLYVYKIIHQRDILNRQVKKKTRQLKILNDNLELKVQKEIQKTTKMQEKLFDSEKMALMGEMIGNIAHQWRQPLSVISSGITAMKVEKEINVLDDATFYKTCNSINTNVQYLSKTIDDFRNYLKNDKQAIEFSIYDNLNSFLNLVEGSIKRHDLTLDLDIDETLRVHGYPNELIQCYLNIFNNAKDVIVNNNELKLIRIKIKKEDNKLSIIIKDNGGGIDDETIKKVFEPYFTTKHQSKGTGLGLFMTYKIITESMSGSIKVENKHFEYKDKIYKGAQFTINVPLNKDNKIE